MMSTCMVLCETNSYFVLSGKNTKAMKNTVSMWALVAMLFFAGDGHADVTVNGQDVTAHLADASLAKVMRQIGQKAGIQIDILHKADYHNAVISDVFENMPLEQGLDRLLNGWNYGLSKDPKTGLVRRLMIVSRRSSVGEMSLNPAPIQIVVTIHEEHDSGQMFEEEGVPDLVDEDSYQTDEDLLNDAPPEVRELIARMQGGAGTE